MKVRLIGLGAVGLPVAALLKNRLDFAAIVDEERKKRYQGYLTYNGRPFDVRLMTPSEADEADLLIISTKNFSLDEALDEASPFVGEKTTIMSLLNGIDAENVISSRFGEERVLPAFIRQLSSSRESLSVTCFSPGVIVFGEKDGSVSERVKRIAALFDEVGQLYEVPTDVLHEKWTKFMLNTCFNTLSAILGADYAGIAENEELFRAARMVAKEVLQVAEAKGVRLDQSDIETMISRMRALRDHGKTSMLQDTEAGRETEARWFSGAVSRLGKKHRIATPYSDFMTLLLEAKRNVLRG